jgi:nitrile hydratase
LRFCSASSNATIQTMDGPHDLGGRMSFGSVLRDIEQPRVVESAPTIHNVVVRTLCSCCPWAVLGLPPAWYKDPPYRSRMIREPRVLLAEMGCAIDDAAEIHVWDSSADMRGGRRGVA